MKLSFFGIGYVGLVQSAVFAEMGNEVMCMDVDEEKIRNLEKGIIPIHEPGLEDIVRKNIAAGRLMFTTEESAVVAHANIIFIAVGTPPQADGSADLSHVVHVAESIAASMTAPKIIVNKSTVPVGTADLVKAIIEHTLHDAGKRISFHVVSNPEFLKEGNAVADSLKPDRIVIGADDHDVMEIMSELYLPFNRSRERFLMMDVRSAELTKYAANCLLATKISFMNEMANIAELFGADVEKIRLGIGADKRIGYDFLYPGCGYGGSCFPKDVTALIHTSENAGFVPHVLKAVHQRNERQKGHLFELIDRHFQRSLSGRTFAMWGLAFKPNTDDMRDAPSRHVIESLVRAGASVRAYDPQSMEQAGKIFENKAHIVLTQTKEMALTDADALIVCTEWSEFRSPDFTLIKEKLKAPVMFDGRNLYDPRRLKQQGFIYYGIGRGSSVCVPSVESPEDVSPCRCESSVTANSCGES